MLKKEQKQKYHSVKMLQIKNHVLLKFVSHQILQENKLSLHIFFIVLLRQFLLSNNCEKLAMLHSKDYNEM